LISNAVTSVRRCNKFKPQANSTEVDYTYSWKPNTRLQDGRAI